MWWVGFQIEESQILNKKVMDFSSTYLEDVSGVAKGVDEGGH